MPQVSQASVSSRHRTTQVWGRLNRRSRGEQEKLAEADYRVNGGPQRLHSEREE